MKQLFLYIWGIWDGFYFRCNRMKYISENENVFRVVHKKYKGPPLTTKTGTTITTGDEIIKIHLYNYNLAKIISTYDSEIKFALFLRQKVKQSLYELDQYIEQLPPHHNIKAIMGTSMLNRGVERLGFSLCDVESNFYYWFKGYLYKGIYLLIHPNGWEYLKRHGRRLKSKHMFMSAQELHQLYVRQDTDDESDHFHRKKSRGRAFQRSQSS